MKLYYSKTSKNPTYFVQQGFRNGKKTTTKNIYRIGKHDDLIKEGHSDPLAYAMEVVADFNSKLKEEKISLDISIDFLKKVLPTDNVISNSTLKNIGYLYFQKIYEDLQIKKFLADVTKSSKIQFDSDLINKILTFDRIISPQSKLSTVNDLNKFLGDPNFSHQDVLRFMDVLSNNYDTYLAYLFDKSNAVVNRDTSICYYDCTNFYFEIEQEDEDYIDPLTNERVKGLRKYGVSKEHRPNPIVQMGLFMDNDGIPLTMDLFHGSNNEQNTVKTLEPKLIKMLKNKKIIYCADAGLGSLAIRTQNTYGGKAFIVTQSIKKLSDELKSEIFADEGYRLLTTNQNISLNQIKSFDPSSNLDLYKSNIYKEILVDSPIDLGLLEEKTYQNGKTKIIKSKAKLNQKLIITFSRQMMEYQRNVRKRQIDRAKALILSADPENIKKGNHDVTRFIKRLNKTQSDSYIIDESRIAEEEKYDGFYCLATNLIEDSAQDIIRVNSNRYKIEDCFRVLKTNFEGRPAYHYRPDRIKAHFLICYTSLLLYRLLEKKLNDKSYDFTINEILKTIKNMNVLNHDDVYYEAAYTGSQVLNALEDVFNLGLNKKYYRIAELNKKNKKISK